MPLYRRVQHACTPPVVRDRTTAYRWTCEQCGDQWEQAAQAGATWMALSRSESWVETPVSSA